VLRDSVTRQDVPLAVGLITNSKETIYAGASGNCRFGESNLVNANSVFYLASMTKPITTAAALILTERNKLDLDAPVSDWITSASRLKVLDGFDRLGQPILRVPARQITPRDLILHTSGFAHPVWNEAALQYQLSHRTKKSETRLDLDSFDQPLMLDPGTRWEYSSIGINILANIIEEVSGRELGEFIKENIFHPLKMDSTDWHLNLSMELRQVDSYIRQPNGALAPLDNEKPGKPVQEYGAGGLFGTAEDYAKFLRVILNNGLVDNKLIFEPSSILAMTQEHFSSKSLGKLYSVNKPAAKNIDLLFGGDGGWSHGFLINKFKLPSGRNPGSLCWFGSSNTFFWVDLKLGIAGIFLSQLSPCADERAVAAFNAFESTYYSQTA